MLKNVQSAVERLFFPMNHSLLHCLSLAVLYVRRKQKEKFKSDCLLSKTKHKGKPEKIFGYKSWKPSNTIVSLYERSNAQEY